METRTDLVRLGSLYGGWIVPDRLLQPGTVCYCAGLGEDGSFDLALAAHGCEVHIFDPTPRSIAYAHYCLVGVERLTFHSIGVWRDTDIVKFFRPHNPAHVSHSVVNLRGTSEFFEARCKSVRQLMDDLGHQQIDLLKLDIEGAEYEVLDKMLTDGVYPGVICAEFDQAVPLRRTLDQIRRLREKDYALISLEGWNFTFLAKEYRPVY